MSKDYTCLWLIGACVRFIDSCLWFMGACQRFLGACLSYMGACLSFISASICFFLCLSKAYGRFSIDYE